MHPQYTLEENPLLPPDLATVFRREPGAAHILHRASWSGFTVEELTYAPGERTVPPVDHHLVTLHLGQPVHLYQARAGQSSEAVHPANVLTITPAMHDDRRIWQEACHAVHFWLHPDLLTRMTQETLGTKAKMPEATLQSCFLSDDQTLVHIANLLLAELRQESASEHGLDTLYIESLRNALIAHLLRQYGTVAVAESPAIRPLCDRSRRRLEAFIEEHLDHDLTLECLSHIVAVSPFHLARQFKSATGSTLHQYVIARRVEAAKRLLLTDRSSATQAAYQVGFGSQSLLNRHFKRLTGTTPAAYARTLRSQHGVHFEKNSGAQEQTKKAQE